LLVLTYFFPPVGGGTSQRNGSLVRRFPALGYEPIVITGSGETQHYWTPSDLRSAERTEGGSVVARVPGPEPEAPTGVRRKLERLLDLDSEWYRWWRRGAYEAALAHVDSCDLIYASLEPYDTAFVAARLSAEFGKPWVADLLDPWALDEIRLHVSALHRRRDLGKMRRGLSTASAIVMSTPEATERVRRELPSLEPALVDAIPMGYEPDDFSDPPPQRGDGTFKIVHTGFLHTEAGLRHRKTARLRQAMGGLYMPVDILTRSHLYLLEAIDKLIARDPSLASVIEIDLAGVPTEADRQVAAKSRLVSFPGFLGHDDSVALIRSADLLFLPMHEPQDGRPAGLVPGKTYEYLATGKPILATVPAGDARDLLRQAGNAHVCDPADVDAIVAAIAAEIGRWREGVVPEGPPRELLEKYSADTVARRLATVFDGVT
jgi:glycosyltransferase involved in cell wall biosynthesis